MTTTTKVCPGCSAVLARNKKACACGHQFAKGNANGPKVPGAEPKKKPGKKPGKNPVKKAGGGAMKAEPQASAFRVGIFNDGGLAILAARGGLELSADETVELAGFCAQHFGESE